LSFTKAYFILFEALRVYTSVSNFSILTSKTSTSSSTFTIYLVNSFYYTFLAVTEGAGSAFSSSSTTSSSTYKAGSSACSSTCSSFGSSFTSS